MFLLYFLLFIFSTDLAQARVYDLYRADYTKGAYCASIGGACSADTDQENSFFMNPAALVGGPEHHVWDVDYNHSNNLSGGMKSTNQTNQDFYLAGYGYTDGKWGAGIGLAGQYQSVTSKASIVDEFGNSHSVNSNTTANIIFIQAPVAYRYSDRLSFGVSLNAMIYREKIVIDNASTYSHPINSFPNLGFTLGTQYKIDEHTEFGGWIRTPLTSYLTQSIDYNNFGTSISIREDVEMIIPFYAAFGFAHKRFGPGQVLYTDVGVIMPTTSGFARTYDTFTASASDGQLTPKGRYLVLEPRLGWKSPWYTNSKGTYLLGTYYSQSRVDQSLNKIHGTAGLSYQFVNWLQGFVAVDVAKNYFQLYLTVR